MDDVVIVRDNGGYYEMLLHSNYTYTWMFDDPNRDYALDRVRETRPGVDVVYDQRIEYEDWC